MPRPRSSWGFTLALDEGDAEPKYLQISRALIRDIQRGRLKPGARLPGSRQLAESLDVHRQTVVAAYAELGSEGWLETSVARGTFVSKSLPVAPPRAFSALRSEVPRRPGFDFESPRRAEASRLRAGVIDFMGGLPDLRLAPTKALASAYRRAVLARGGRALAYGEPRGQPRLRRALASLLSATRALAVSDDELLVTRGSQMALHLVGRTLLSAGDVVAVEALGYRPAWSALTQTGATLEPIAVDERGLRVDALAERLCTKAIRAVYLTPHHHYPTTVTLTADRRLALLALAERHRFAIIEDDYDHEFHYEGRPVLPLASVDRAGVVIYIGTLSKLLAPGLRVGYLVAPEPVVSRLAEERRAIDRQGDPAIEEAVAELIEEGELQRHARRAKRVYQARRDALVSLLEARLRSQLSFAVPDGGLAVWARVARGINAERWAASALEHGVEVQAGRQFSVDGSPTPHLRLGFAHLNQRELEQAVARLAKAARMPS